MKSSTGRWVTGNDFFDREQELIALETRVRDLNHTLLTGQRRMGKTSLARELGRRLEAQGWGFLPVNVEGATSPEDVIARMAEAVHPIRPIARRLAASMRHWLRDVSNRVEQITAYEFSVKIRSGLEPGNWRRHGQQLLHDCAHYDRPVLLVIDELPIFLNRLRKRDAHAPEEFLSWLRGVLQDLGDGSLVLIVSGSIGLQPLVTRLGIPDRINHLDPFRLGPWSRGTCIACFERLAESYDLTVDEGVPKAVYDALGLGIPQHLQSFFARLRDFATMQRRGRLSISDVDEVYYKELLGPSGSSDLAYYETRLRDGLEEETHRIAVEILAEAATQEVFTAAARRNLERRHSALVDDAPDRIADALDVLMHDGYLEACDDGYRFLSRLLKDWWSARFRDHHAPLAPPLSTERRAAR